jgi:acyl-coenzyme A synthetase/AMP-(fatty) acid ligase
VLLSVTTLSFDIAGLELLLPLLVGARVEILPARAARDGSQMVAALARSGATLMQATPSTWRLLLEQDWSACRLERALCGGEALPRALADRLLARGLELWNLYGPTETTIWSTRQRVEPTDAVAAPDATCRIGRPIAQTQVYVLDGDLQPVPAGVAGELFIAGAGVARGYLRRPALTAERFLPDPFGPRPGARMYRTGDRVRCGQGGALEFLGRSDDQIKLRGHRVELGEIEAVLLAHPGVASAALAVQGQGEDAELAAYLVSRAGPALSDSELRAWLSERLPPYMSVSSHVWVASLPLTLNGKVDRARLPAVPRTSAAQRTARPASATEVGLLQIWSDVLASADLGIEDDFFQVGGHSLRATRVVAQIRATFQVPLSLAYFFEHPTIVELAAEIERRLAAGAAPADAAREGQEEISL